MKKLLMLMLAVLMALTLVGCSSNNNGGGQAPADNRSEVQKIIADALTMTLEELAKKAIE